MIRQLSVSLFLLLLVSLLPACSLEKPSSQMKVTSMDREVDKNKPGFEICNSLKLTENDVVNYFSMAEPVEEYDFYSNATIMPCKYRGSITINDDVLNWIIMAGGAAYLYKSGTVDKRYLCTEKCCDAIPGLC